MVLKLKQLLVYLIGLNLSALILFTIIHHSTLPNPRPKRMLSRFIRTLEESSNENNDGEEDTEEEGHHDDGVHISQGGLIIMFTFLSLLSGGILKELKKKTNIPYSPMLLVLGIIFGLSAKKIDVIGKSVLLVNQIDPHTLLMIFIPTLIFESSYNSNGYTMNKSKWQILLMAGPGVLVTTVIVAFSLQYIFGYKDTLSISEAMVIGSIVSTTDPVAVVALLKELGTSIRFNTILEGESLLNDGTAYVFFLICMEVVATGEFKIFASLVKFVRLSFGGPIFGILAGWISISWLKHILKDNSLIVLITFVVTYLVFFFAETYLQVSGILALVCLGLYLGTYAKVHFSHESDHAVHTVWSFIAFCLETLIFIITGTFIGEALSNSSELKLELWDFFKALIFYFFLMLVRYLLLLAQYPILNRIGYKIDLKSALIMSWGGLRGAIALSLAMLVVLDNRFDERFKDLCLLYVLVIIVMTVILNGLTIKFLMQLTGFLKKDKTKEKILRSVRKEIIVHTISCENDLMEGPELDCADWKEVEKLGGVQNLIKKQFKDLKKEEKEKEEKNKKDEGRNSIRGKSKAMSNPDLNIHVSNSLGPEIQARHDMLKIPKQDLNRKLSDQKNDKEKLNNKLASPKRLNLNLNDCGLQESYPSDSDEMTPYKKPREIKPDKKIDKNNLAINVRSPERKYSLGMPILYKNPSEKVSPSPYGNIFEPIELEEEKGTQRNNDIKKEKKNLNKKFDKFDKDNLDESINLQNKGIVKSHDPDQDRNSSEDSDDPFKDVGREEIKSELRFRIYSLVRSVLNERHTKHLTSSLVVRALRNICDISSDHLDKKISIWEYTSIYISDHQSIKWIMKLNSLPLIGNFFNNYLSSKLSFEYNLISNLVVCCKDVSQSLNDLPLDKDYHIQIEEVKKELLQDLALGEEFLDTLKGDFPDLVKMIHTKTAAYAVVQYQKDQLHIFEKEGLISQHEKMKQDILLDKRIIQINKYRPKFSQKEKNIAFSTFVLDFPAFRDLNQKSRNMIQESTIKVSFSKDGSIYQSGEDADYIYLIIKGVATDVIDEKTSIKKYTGGIMNFGNLCSPDGKYLSSCVTITDCKMYKIRTCKFLINIFFIIFL